MSKVINSLKTKRSHKLKFANRIILLAVIKLTLLVVFSITLLNPTTEQALAQDNSCPQSHPQACGNIGPNGEEVCSASDDCSTENITVNANAGPDCRDNSGYCETLSPSCPSGTSGGDVVCNQDTGWCETVSCSETTQDVSGSPSNPNGDTDSIMNGKYKNIYGNVVVEDCTPSPDNDYCKGKHVGNYCDLKTGVCIGGDDVWLWKFVCDGETTDCRSNRTNSSNPQDGQSLTEGVTCGQTVQIDVFNKQCDEDPNNWSCNDDNLIDYIVWYSGDCDVGADACEKIDKDAMCPAGQKLKDGSAENTCSEKSECDQYGLDTCADGCCVQCIDDPGDGDPGDGDPGDGDPGDGDPGDGDPGDGDPGDGDPGDGDPGDGDDPYSDAMCECDGIEASSAIIAGSEVTFTAFGKVEGENTNYARFTGMSFSMFAGDSGPSADLIGASRGPVDAKVVEETTNKVRYQSDWTFKLPPDLDPNRTYAVHANANCERKTSAQAQSEPNVLGEETENGQSGFFAKITNFFKSLFGAGEKDVSEEEETNEEATLQQLKLRNVQPANVVEKTCSTILFEFSEASGS